MRKSTAELNRIPNEFHEGGAPELPALPDEFNRNAPIVTDDRAARRKRLRKIMMILAAAGVLAIVTTVAAPAPTESPETEAEAPAPEPTPEPVPLPDSQVIYFQTFSVGHGIILLTDPAHTTAVHVRLYDERIDASATEYEHDLTPEEIASGRYDVKSIELSRFRGENAEAFDALGPGTYPKPYLQAEVSYRLDDGTEGTTERHSYYQAEEWVGFDYHKDSEPESKWRFPGYFVISVSDPVNGTPRFTADPDKALEPGEIFVSVTVDGETALPELWIGRHVEDTMTFDDGSSFTTHTYYYLLKRPESFPPSGTAKILIRQRFVHYDFVYEHEETINY